MSRARDRVLEAVRTAPRPLGVDEIATAVGLGRNAVRHHLAALEAGELIRAEVDRAGHRGRPRRVFLPGPGPVGPYERLALALLHARRTGASLETAGRAVAPPDGDLLSFLAAEGFDPRPSPDGSIALAACPLAHAAEADPTSVCTVHRGLVSALADRPDEVWWLVACGPGRCRIERRRAGGG
ncbi:MAG TPA: helix-turn-helix domain-containing protein [Acidimicrobiia bacterium]|nr:helix-turn-helix domain-containing protein [Acidimicrobiia bacterium]